MSTAPRNAGWILVLLAVLAGCGGSNLSYGHGPAPLSSVSPSLTPSPTATPSGKPVPTPTAPLLPQAGTIYLGAYADPGGQKPPAPNALSLVEQSVGRKMALSLHYYGFFDTFPGTPEADDLANGRVPVESWDCQPSNAALASGQYDDNVRKVAQNLKGYGHLIFMRYMWEMNLPVLPHFRSQCYDPNYDEPAGKFSPAYFIAAWNHLRQIFAQEGATNVVWIWCPAGASDPLQYYPGDANTDWVGVDQYNDTNTTFYLTYRSAYTWLAPLRKPILIDETGASAISQAAFFGSAVSTLKQNYPLVRGYVYFDSPHGAIQDWAIKPGTDGFNAFVKMGNDKYFSAFASP